MEAVVMAAGEGRRMRPLTERWPKPLLPIDGRPVIATLLRELCDAGCTRVWIVTGHLAERLEALVGDGTAFGLDVSFVRQPEPVGSADTVVRALAAGASGPLLVTGADTLYSSADLGRFAAEFRDADAAGAVAVRRDPPPAPPHRHAVRIRGGRVERVLDDDPSNPLAGAPLWVVGERLVPFLDGLPGPPFELADVLQRGVDSGEEVLGIEIGRTRDLTDPLDLVEENFPYLR
jgi:NDP-sugar pyrophosphorylase family protein